MRDKYINQLRKLNNLLIEMGHLIEESIELAVTALVNQDVEKAKRAIAFDENIDDMEKEIENLCLNLLLCQQPVAKDLRFVSAAMKMVTDMERIGDQAADISEITLLLAKEPYIKELSNIKKMAVETTDMVMKSIEAYIENNSKKARDVIAQDDVVDALFQDTKTELITLINENIENGEQAADFLMIAKYFERIGDHAVNIMEAAQSVAVDKIQLSPDAKAEMDIIKEAVMNITKMTVEAFDSYHYNLAKKIEPLEEVIDDMVVSAKNHHVERLKLGQRKNLRHTRKRG